MGKKRDRSPKLFSETKDILALLNKDEPQEILTIFVPSHDLNNRPLAAAQIGHWLDAGMQLVADLFRGGTAFEATSGIYKTNEGNYLRDKPRVIETLAKIEDIQNTLNLNRIVGFAKRMGKELNQAAVMITISNVVYYVEDYSGV